MFENMCTARGVSVSAREKPSERGRRHIREEAARLEEDFHDLLSAGAGVNVVESEQAGGTGILEVQTESLQRICDLHHGSFNEPKALRINPRRRLLDR
jgi:hypothetical protein